MAFRRESVAMLKKYERSTFLGLKASQQPLPSAIVCVARGARALEAQGTRRKSHPRRLVPDPSLHDNFAGYHRGTVEITQFA